MDNPTFIDNEHISQFTHNDQDRNDDNDYDDYNTLNTSRVDATPSSTDKQPTTQES